MTEFTLEMLRRAKARITENTATTVPVNGNFQISLAARYQGRPNRRHLARDLGTTWKLLLKRIKKNRHRK